MGGRAGKMDSGRVVKIVLYFQTNLEGVNEKYSLNLGDRDESSWILELHGLDEHERDALKNKYDRLKRPGSSSGSNVEWITGETPLIDIQSGSLDQFHDVTPFFEAFMEKLNFVHDPNNPPANTEGFQVEEVRTWLFHKK